MHFIFDLIQPKALPQIEIASTQAQYKFNQKLFSTSTQVPPTTSIKIFVTWPNISFADSWNLKITKPEQYNRYLLFESSHKLVFLHLTQVASLGGFILFVGFLAFNGGSQLSISNPGDGLALSIAVMSTVLGGSTSAMITMLLYKVTDAIRGQDHYWSLIVTINGGLAGIFMFRQIILIVCITLH